MGKNIKSSEDLFQHKEAKSEQPVAPDTSAYENKTTRQAGAAQKSARPRKSATAFRTISEVATDLGVQQHVLRFWETKFSQVKPLKRGGGRRYYRPEDLSLLRAIHCLLYVEGYTIKGVQKLLRDVGKKQIIANFSGESVKDPAASHRSVDVTPEISDTSAKAEVKQGLDDAQRDVLKSVLAELKELRGMIKKRD
ncbi:MAG: MerR family transcriptional regulator [Zetaproteobacteria bacterium]|nr:MAG: MerR family transcriptional regulator [Zetaproteobacteria bacterium]